MFDSFVSHKHKYVENEPPKPNPDLVVVTRCKDCTYSKPLNAMAIECTVWASARLKTDYCSCGERRNVEE